MMAKRVRTGDIIEIATKRGLSYAQLTHVHESLGALLRVLSGFHKSRPQHLSELSRHNTQFQTFFPLQAAVNRNIVAVVGNEPIPDQWKEFPVFRSGIPDPGSRTVSTWFLWDGSRAWRIPNLSPAQRMMPIKEIINDTLLIERIESGWTAESDESG